MSLVEISEIPGRTRLQLAGPVPEGDLDALIKLSTDIKGVTKVRVYGRIGQMAIEYDAPNRADVLGALRTIDAQAIAEAKSGYAIQLEPRKHKLVMDLATLVGAHYARRWFLPTPIRAVFVVAGYMAFLRAALHELVQPRLTVPVLDASAIGISFVKRDVNTAGQTMFLLKVGELLEDYTRAMSAIGLNTDIVKLVRTGGKPIALGACCWVAIACVSLGMQHVIGIW